MGLVEIILIIVGAVVLIISYAVPAGRAEKDVAQTPQIDEKMIRDLVDREISGAKNHINDMVDETLSYSMEKTERAMERLTNEKIMAISEYSEQVLAAINKNHQEVMFLYDMLKDKHENLVNTVSEASRKAKEIRQTVQDAEITVKEAAEMIAEDAEAAAGRAEAAENAAENQNGTVKLQPVKLQKEEKAERQDTGLEESAEKAEFVPIAPKRVELLPGVFEEEGISGAAEGGEPSSETDREEEKNYNNNDKILRLHKLGKSKTAIARELGLGVGEVKLVIDLFEQG